MEYLTQTSPPVFQLNAQLGPSWLILRVGGHAGAGQALMSLEEFLEVIVQLGSVAECCCHHTLHSTLQPQNEKIIVLRIKYFCSFL